MLRAESDGAIGINGTHFMVKRGLKSHGGIGLSPTYLTLGHSIESMRAWLNVCVV